MSNLKLNKQYRLNWRMKMLCGFGILLGILLLTHTSGTHFYLSIILSPMIILISCCGLFLNYYITKEGIIAEIGSFVQRKVFWKDVEMIYDDRFLFAHFYIFRIRNENILRTFGYNNGCTNYKDFLRNAVLHVRPDTEVDKKILNVTSLTTADIGLQYHAT